MYTVNMDKTSLDFCHSLFLLPPLFHLSAALVLCEVGASRQTIRLPDKLLPFWLLA